MNLSEAYIKMLKDVYNNPEFQSAPRGQAIREKLYYSIIIDEPTSKPIVTNDPERNLTIADYTQKELDWYLSGSIEVEDAIKISKFWGKLTNPDGHTINSNYGYLILFDKSEGETYTPFEWAKNSLIKDKDSRQAIMRFNKPKHAFDGNKDFVCTMYAIFHIRDNKLYLSMKQRSADLMFGIVYDMPFFVYLQEKMLSELKPFYPELEMGYYHHLFDSLHIYERNFIAVEKMIGK